MKQRKDARKRKEGHEGGKGSNKETKKEQK